MDDDFFLFFFLTRPNFFSRLYDSLKFLRLSITGSCVPHHFSLLRFFTAAEKPEDRRNSGRNPSSACVLPHIKAKMWPHITRYGRRLGSLPWPYKAPALAPATRTLRLDFRAQNPPFHRQKTPYISSFNLPTHTYTTNTMTQVIFPCASWNPNLSSCIGILSTIVFNLFQTAAHQHFKY